MLHFLQVVTLANQGLTNSTLHAIRLPFPTQIIETACLGTMQIHSFIPRPQLTAFFTPAYFFHGCAKAERGGLGTCKASKPNGIVIRDVRAESILSGDAYQVWFSLSICTRMVSLIYVSQSVRYYNITPTSSRSCNSLICLT